MRQRHWTYVGPHTYFVAWPNIDLVKAGYSDCGRWRKFQLRGGELIGLWSFQTTMQALRMESQLDRLMRSAGGQPLSSRAEAIPWLGTDGGGWMECQRLHFCRAIELIRSESDRMAERIRPGTHRSDPTYERTD